MLTTVKFFYPNANPRLRFFALWYFTILLAAWTVAGHTILGFEQSYAQPVAGVVAAILAQFLFEWIDSRIGNRTPRYSGGFIKLLNFLPPAIIPGLASAMLIYPNERLWPVAFAAAVSIASKAVFRAPVGQGMTQHIFNPSNFGITLTLLLLSSSVGLAPPYMFTKNITGAWHWILPGIILILGTIVHAKFTGRLPLVLAWTAGFLLQGAVRVAVFDVPWIVPLVPMTSAAFTLFTLFMIPDPATTPISRKGQIAFGMSVALIYGVLLMSHVVFGLFIALALTSAARGAYLLLASARSSAQSAREPIRAVRSVAAAQ